MKDLERYGLSKDIVSITTARNNIGTEELIKMAVRGSRGLTDIALKLVNSVKDEMGNVPLTYPDTAYGLPLLCGWKGITDMDVNKAIDLLSDFTFSDEISLEAGFIAGENAMYAAEIVESITYLKGRDGDGFVPDRTLRELGLSLVDETIPGAVLFLGGENTDVVKMVRDCQSKGMIILASGTYPDIMREEGIAMGLDRMLYPLGDLTGTVHALNFTVRAALTFGGVQPGDNARLKEYLAKRPKVVVIQTGGLGDLDAAFAFAALLHSAVIVSDQELPEIPGAVAVRKVHGEMIQAGIEERGIVVTLQPMDLPVSYGPAFEGELIRRPETYVEAGGNKSRSFELLVSRGERDINDGTVKLIGKDIDSFEKGSNIPLGLIVEVYGKEMQSDLEAVMERHIHHFMNFAEGVWHAGQRNSNWLRISDNGKKAGLTLKDLGKILVHKIKEEFGKIVTRVQATVITDAEELEKRMKEAVLIYEARDERMKGLKDDLVDTFYTCTMCQSFAPDHVCIVTPERLGLCGAINWLDAKASFDLSPNGPNRPFQKGPAVDEKKGEWEGINDIVVNNSHGTVDRVCLYSLMDSPMTSCGCFEVIAAMMIDMQSVILVDREYTGMTPVGMKFSSLAGSIGGGRQTPGFMGIGKKYITSDKFIAAESGILRISWMPKHLKDSIASEFRKRSQELGVPDLLDRIADETITEDAEGLITWMSEKDHPALYLDPLL